MKLTIKRNEERNGVELYFDGKPAQSVIDKIKSVTNERGKRVFFWHRQKKMWYAKATPDTLAFVKELKSKPIASQEQAKKKERKSIEAIWATLDAA